MKLCSVKDCERKHKALGLCGTHYRRWLTHKTLDVMDVMIRPCGADIDSTEYYRYFWSQVSLTADNTRCWEWRNGTNEGGYGTISKDGTHQLAHRMAWRLAYGEFPGGMLLHSCDNPPCCNPKHLRIGTHIDNSRDMIERGRMPVRRGEHNSRAKLTELDVRNIKHHLASGEQCVSIAKEYGMSTAPIYLIRNGVNWAHVKL